MLMVALALQHIRQTAAAERERRDNQVKLKLVALVAMVLIGSPLEPFTLAAALVVTLAELVGQPLVEMAVEAMGVKLVLG